MMKDEEITTLSGIVLKRDCTGPVRWFVNGVEVDYWTYEKTPVGGGFYSERFVIGHAATEMDKATGKYS